MNKAIFSATLVLLSLMIGSLSSATDDIEQVSFSMISIANDGSLSFAARGVRSSPFFAKGGYNRYQTLTPSAQSETDLRVESTYRSDNGDEILVFANQDKSKLEAKVYLSSATVEEARKHSNFHFTETPEPRLLVSAIHMASKQFCKDSDEESCEYVEVASVIFSGGASPIMKLIKAQ